VGSERSSVSVRLLVLPAWWSRRATPLRWGGRTPRRPPSARAAGS